MGVKKTQKEANEIFYNRGLILDDKYINTKTKMKCHNSEGYKFYLSLGVVLDNRVKKFNIVSKSNVFSDDNINLFLKINNSKSILQNSYENEKSRLELLCGCGNIYYSNWNHLSNLNNLMCQKCAEENRHKNKKKKYEEIINILNREELDLIEYINSHNISVIDKEGYKYKTNIYNLNKKRLIKFHKLNPYSLDNIKLYTNKNDIPIDICFNKIKNKENIEIRNFMFPCKCINCDNIYYMRWNDIIKNKRFNCKRCSKSESNLEYEIKKYLDDINIRYVQQKTFIGCKYKRKLPFDFYLLDYNCVIEVQGRQHYYETKMFSRTLEEQKYYDKIKKDYCLYNDIIYIEIPYYNVKNGKYKNTINNILG